MEFCQRLQAATAVATTTMAPLNIEALPNKLIELVVKGPYIFIQMLRSILNTNAKVHNQSPGPRDQWEGEKVVSNLTRFVVIIWIFVVIILSSSYAANLSSVLTMKQLEPTDTSIQELLKKGEYVGCQQGTFIRALLKQLKFDDSKLKFYNSSMQYHEALQKGSQNGGIAAYIDSVGFINFFMARYCDKYTVAGPIYKTVGTGFVFQKGSPLVADVSREILKLKESDKMAKIDQKWFGSQATCSQQGSDDVSNSLSFYSFRAQYI